MPVDIKPRARAQPRTGVHIWRVDPLRPVYDAQIAALYGSGENRNRADGKDELASAALCRTVEYKPGDVDLVEARIGLNSAFCDQRCSARYGTTFGSAFARDFETHRRSAITKRFMPNFRDIDVDQSMLELRRAQSREQMLFGFGQVATE